MLKHMPEPTRRGQDGSYHHDRRIRRIKAATANTASVAIVVGIVYWFSHLDFAIFLIGAVAILAAHLYVTGLIIVSAIWLTMYFIECLLE